MVSNWNLGDWKSLQISRRLLSNLADVSNVDFWMVSIVFWFLRFLFALIITLGIGLSAPFTNNITINFMVTVFFSVL